MRGEIARHFFQLRSEALRQFFLERGRRGFVRFSAARLRVFVKFFGRRRDLTLQVVARLRYFVLPLLGACGAFGADGLRSGFSRSGLNLLARFGEKARDVTRELQRCVGGARRRREYAYVVGIRGLCRWWRCRQG